MQIFFPKKENSRYKNLITTAPGMYNLDNSLQEWRITFESHKRISM